jgi:hypothetical protein
MNVPRRIFTQEEDQLMLLQSSGKLSMHKLERMIGASRDSIIKRMAELGATPVIIRHARGMQKDKVEPVSQTDSYNFSPSVGADKLLQRLIQWHGDRRYGSNPIVPTQCQQYHDEHRCLDSEPVQKTIPEF